MTECTQFQKIVLQIPSFLQSAPLRHSRGLLGGNPLFRLFHDLSPLPVISVVFWSEIQCASCRRASNALLVGGQLPGSPITTFGDDDTSPTTDLGDDGTSPITTLRDDGMYAIPEDCPPNPVIPAVCPSPSFPWSVGRESTISSFPRSLPTTRHFRSLFCRKSNALLVGRQLPGSPITTFGDDDTSPTTNLEDDVQQ